MRKYWTTAVSTEARFQTLGFILNVSALDVFAGAGGMTLGFSKMFGHAFDSVWANDFNRFAVNTYNANFGDHCTCGDIVDILGDSATEIPQ